MVLLCGDNSPVNRYHTLPAARMAREAPFFVVLPSISAMDVAKQETGKYNKEKAGTEEKGMNIKRQNRKNNICKRAAGMLLLGGAYPERMQCPGSRQGGVRRSADGGGNGRVCDEQFKGTGFGTV